MELFQHRWGFLGKKHLSQEMQWWCEVQRSLTTSRHARLEADA